jgi:4-hydroxybenzoate polyprenyltransferase
MSLRHAPEIGRLLAKVSRPQNIVYSGLLSAMMALIYHSSAVIACACYAQIVLLYAVAAGFNNLHDLETDKINKRFDNPFVNNSLSLVYLKGFFIACFFGVGLLQIVLAQPASLLLTLLYVLLTLAYSHPKIDIKARSLLGTLLLSVCYGALPFLLGAAQKPSLDVRHLLTFSGLQILLLAPLLLAKDSKDYKGDTLTNKNTPLVRYGQRGVSVISISVALLAVVLYIWLAHKGSNRLLISTALAALYLLLIAALHHTKGALARPLRNLLVCTLLGMSFSLLGHW